MNTKTRRWVTLLTMCMLVALLPAAAFAASAVATNIADQKFVVDEWTEFTFTIDADDTDVNKMINAHSEFASPAVLEGLEYWETETNAWQKLSHDPSDLGPATGFPMTDASMKFRAKINTPGQYSFSVNVYEVGSKETLCETTATFTVQAGSELITDIGKKNFVVGVPTEFTFSTKANGHKGMMVVGSANFDADGAIEKLEYYEVRDGKWYDLGDDPTDFGPAQGFPMSDATSKFRVTFKKAGIYSFTASMKRVEDSKILCSTDVEFPVVMPVAAAPADTSVPKTGDDSNLALWLSLVMLSVAAMVLMMRKKQEA